MFMISVQRSVIARDGLLKNSIASVERSIEHDKDLTLVLFAV